MIVFSVAKDFDFDSDFDSKLLDAFKSTPQKRAVRPLFCAFQNHFVSRLCLISKYIIFV